jgi:hypothetical protein
MLTEFLIGLGQYPNAGARALGRARAQIGYDAFMAGKRVAIVGIGNRVAVFLMRFVPITAGGPASARRTGRQTG